MLCFSLLAVWACKKKYDNEFIGPEMKSASANFQILEPLSANYFNGNKFTVDTISFARDTTIYERINPSDTTSQAVPVLYQRPFNTVFKARFNESVRWTIQLKGLASQAEKTLTGVGDHLDTTVTDAVWNGNADSFNYFVAGDTVVATLSVLGSDLIQTNKVVVVYATAFAPDQGMLLNDFEGGFSQITYNDKLDQVQSPVPGITSSIPAPQGKGCMMMTGLDNNGDYFVGGYQQKLKKGVFKDIPLSEIYFNFYIYGFSKDAGLTPNATKLNIGISEDDTNPNGSFEADIEDSFEKQVNVDWQGWKLISVRYSELKRSISLTNGGNGNNILQPDRAYSLNANLIASPNGSRVGAAIDYVTITFGKPFEK